MGARGVIARAVGHVDGRTGAWGGPGGHGAGLGSVPAVVGQDRVGWNPAGWEPWEDTPWAKTQRGTSFWAHGVRTHLRETSYDGTVRGENVGGGVIGDGTFVGTRDETVRVLIGWPRGVVEPRRIQTCRATSTWTMLRGKDVYSATPRGEDPMAWYPVEREAMAWEPFEVRSHGVGRYGAEPAE